MIRREVSNNFCILIDLYYTIIINHKGVGGRGICGNFISGIFINAGFGGRARGLIPPFAKGIYVERVGCLKTFYAITGALKTSDGILLIALGLF